MKALNKNDKRVVLTEQRIKEAFVEAFSEHQFEIETITIAEICRKSGIHRTTFYKHYDNVIQLYNAVKTDTIEEFKTAIAEMPGLGDEDYLVGIIDLYKKYIFKLDLYGFYWFNDEIGSVIEVFSKEKFNEKYILLEKEYIKDVDLNDVFDLITGGFVYATLVAIRRNPTIDSKLLAKRLLKLGYATYQGIISYK